MFNTLNISKLPSNLGFFRFKELEPWLYLITNDIWEYSYLTEKEFKDFIEWKISSWEKYNELRDKWFIKWDNEEAYKLNMAKKFAKKNHFLAFWPSLHIIVTTLRCNHQCRYCHAAVAPMTAKELDMTKDTAKKVVDTIFYTSNPNVTIEFQWWEPLVNWDIVKYIVEYAEVKSLHLWKNLELALVSNLTLMDDEKLEYIMEHNIGISTSLDWNEELHNYNRVFFEWNSYEKVTYWIKKINKMYKDKWIKTIWNRYKKVGALLTVTRKTLWKYKEVIDTYVNLWLDWIFLRPLNPYGFASAKLKELWYSVDEFLDFYIKSMEYILKLNEQGTFFREMLSSIFLTKILTDKDPNYLDERSPCWACVGQVAYNYDGKIYSCDEWRMLGRMWDDNFLMTTLKETGSETYKNMINSETTKIMVQASTLDWLPGYNESVYKPYIGVCPIHSYKTTWNIFSNYKKDFKRYLDERILDYLFKKLRNDKYKRIFEDWVLFEKKESQCEWFK